MQNLPPIHYCPANGDLDRMCVYMLDENQEACIRHPEWKEQGYTLGTALSHPEFYYRQTLAGQNTHQQFKADNGLFCYLSGKHTSRYLAMAQREQLQWSNTTYQQRLNEMDVSHTCPQIYSPPKNCAVVPALRGQGCALVPGYQSENKNAPIVVELSKAQLQLLVTYAIRNGLAFGVPPPIDAPVAVVPHSVVGVLANATLQKGSLFDCSPTWLVSQIEAEREQARLAAEALAAKKKEAEESPPKPTLPQPMEPSQPVSSSEDSGSKVNQPAEQNQPE